MLGIAKKFAIIVPLQICNNTVAVLQNKIIIFYSPLYIYICHFLSFHLVLSYVSLSSTFSISSLSTISSFFSGVAVGSTEWVEMVVRRRGPGGVVDRVG